MREIMRTVPAALACLALGFLAWPLQAQVKIEKRRPAPAKGYVSIENSFGSVKVRGWDQNEVLVKGELAPGARGLDLDGDKEGIDIDIDEPDHWFYAPSEDGAFQTHLEIMVPKGSNLSVDTVNASIDIAGVFGEMELDTVNGGVAVVAGRGGIEVDTMTGTVEISADGASMAVETITGSVTLRGVAGVVEVDSVEGAISIVGRDLRSVAVETITGDVSVIGTLAKSGELEVDTFSGAVTLTLPEAVRAEFEIETFSGEITSDFGPSAPVSERFEPYRFLEFATGGYDEYEIEVTTHEGDVRIRKADAGSGGS